MNTSELALAVPAPEETASGWIKDARLYSFPPDYLLTVPEVAAFLRYSLGYTRNLVWRNELPVIRLSTGAVRCRKKDLDRWITERSYVACSTH